MTASARELFGTDEPAPERRRLQAGPLSAVLEEGNLRDIRWHGIEAVRAINYLARDASWGTYLAAITGLDVSEEADGFIVAYDGLCAGPEGRFHYRMTIRGEASGTLALEARGRAETDFPTNRTGFVVLHPAEAAGTRLLARHSDGRRDETAFPGTISPSQPVLDIAALTHAPAPGVTCTVEMEGDAFEMEDQRNWTDASFKTYVRPLSKPRPYVIAKNAEDRQRITVQLAGQPAGQQAAGEAHAQIRLGGDTPPNPEPMLFLDPEEPIPADPTPFAGLAAGLVARYDTHDARGTARLREAAEFAQAIGAELIVEVIFDARDPAREAEAAAGAIRAAGMSPAALLASPRREFKTRASGTPPGEHGTAALVDALRRAAPGPAVGAGTPSFFTEFNRNPPEPGADFVFFGTAATVHAADDLSVVETTTALPAVLESARRLAPGLPLWFGPCLIGMRHNPYGAAPAENPRGGRVPMARVDPRHGALFGAAWGVAVAAHAAAAGAARLTLAAPTGPFGLTDGSGHPRPIRGLYEALSGAKGQPGLAVSGAPPGLAALAWRAADGPRLLLGNLASEPITVDPPLGSVSLLGADGRWGGASALRGPFTIRPFRTVLLR